MFESTPLEAKPNCSYNQILTMRPIAFYPVAFMLVRESSQFMGYSTQPMNQQLSSAATKIIYVGTGAHNSVYSRSPYVSHKLCR